MNDKKRDEYELLRILSGLCHGGMTHSHHIHAKKLIYNECHEFSLTLHLLMVECVKLNKKVRAIRCGF